VAGFGQSQAELICVGTIVGVQGPVVVIACER
jgi:hypothetical protein